MEESQGGNEVEVKRKQSSNPPLHKTNSIWIRRIHEINFYFITCDMEIMNQDKIITKNVYFSYIKLYTLYD